MAARRPPESLMFISAYTGYSDMFGINRTSTPSVRGGHAMSHGGEHR